MTRRSLFLVIFALLAAATATAFLAISVDHGVYAPGARDVNQVMKQHAGIRQVQEDLPPRAQRWLSPVKILRKTYSVVAFAIVGFLVSPLVRRRHRLRWDAALVAGFSALIEVVQKFAGSSEGYGSNVFDIACGALGGLIGGLAWNVVMHRRIRDRAAP